MNETKSASKRPVVEPKLRQWENFNIAALTDDGRTISTQMWDGTFEKAKAVLLGWVADAKWNGNIVQAIIHNHQTKVSVVIKLGRLSGQIIEEKVI